MSEVRPWVGAIGTLAELSTRKELKIIDCSQASARQVSLQLLMNAPVEPRPEEREQLVWADINAAFSQPVTSTEKTAEYAPTQVLAEVFRSAQFDGIMYKSSLGKGTNVALFDLTGAAVVSRRIFQCRGVLHKFDVGEDEHIGGHCHH